MKTRDKDGPMWMTMNDATKGPDRRGAKATSEAKAGIDSTYLMA